MKLNRRGRLGIVAVAAACVGIAMSNLASPSQRPAGLHDHVIEWDYLEGEEGSDLNRLETPEGWVVENADGYLLFIPDKEKKWRDPSSGGRS